MEQLPITKRNPHQRGMFARDITRYCTVNDDAERLLETAINKLGLSAGAYSRVLKAGRTIADLAGTVEIQPAQIAEAIQYRSPDRRLKNPPTKSLGPALPS